MSKQIVIKHDKERLDFLKKVVNEGQAVFFIVGVALAEIKTKELFKFDGHETFNDFCEKEWGWTKRYCNQLIVDASIVKELPPGMRQLITTENAARELAKLPAILRPAVAHVASKGGVAPITGAAVRAASPLPLPKPPPAPKPKGPPAKKPAMIQSDKIKDGTGMEVPEGILPMWNRAHEVVEVLTYVKAIRHRIQKVYQENDVLWNSLRRAGTYQALTAKLMEIEYEVKSCKPFAICPTCLGKLPESCTSCGQTGLVSEHFWDNCVPAEDKAMREKVK
jgi:hypothetical protein